LTAATNRGIDEIRELRDPALYAPSARPLQDLHPRRGPPITDAAFNALLKTLEEPPAT